MAQDFYLPKTMIWPKLNPFRKDIHSQRKLNIYNLKKKGGGGVILGL